MLYCFRYEANKFIMAFIQMFIVIKSRYFVLGNVAKKTFENIRKRFNKARNKMIKVKKSGTST